MEISGGILKNDDISAAAFQRFISQPASGRSSALPCLAAILVLSEIWRLLRLHGLFFGTRNSNDAPIKETLAAGIVDLARVRADSVVVDPMCGSGTFLIESAYKALKVAPGLRRNFAAEQWSQIPETAWRNARAEAMDAIDRQGAFKAFGFDVDDIAVELTRNNAKKAGVGSKLTVKQQDISKYSQIEGSITIVNPPYGERMLEIKEAEELYKKMGQRLCPSKENPCYIISPHEEFEVFFGKKADKKRKLYNGMIKCNLYMYFK